MAYVRPCCPRSALIQADELRTLGVITSSQFDSLIDTEWELNEALPNGDTCAIGQWLDPALQQGIPGQLRGPPPSDVDFHAVRWLQKAHDMYRIPTSCRVDVYQHMRRLVEVKRREAGGEKERRPKPKSSERSSSHAPAPKSKPTNKSSRNAFKEVAGWLKEETDQNPSLLANANDGTKSLSSSSQDDHTALQDFKSTSDDQIHSLPNTSTTPAAHHDTYVTMADIFSGKYERELAARKDLSETSKTEGKQHNPELLIDFGE